ncbi:MAG: type II toxin-antitoxin system VapC family toxin [Puniceicoccaceae bacterium]
MKKLFVDTGAFLAKEIRRDQHHAEAVDGWQQLAEIPEVLYTSEHCMDETATLLARRTSYAFAGKWGADVLSSGITVLQAQRDDWTDAFRLMRKFADQNVSFTDCLSFRLMKRHRIRSVFGFDHHFTAAGFGLWRV